MVDDAARSRRADPARDPAPHRHHRRGGRGRAVARIDARDAARRRCAVARSSRTTPTSSATSCRAGSAASSRASFYLDTQDLLAVAHPDAPDLRLETFTRALFGTEERHRALDDAADTLRVMARLAFGARAGEPRYAAARAALANYAPDSPWIALLDERQRRAQRARSARLRRDRREQRSARRVRRGAIAAALRDAERGERHFPGYRVREAQVELALRFARVLEHGGRVLIEGGTGVGKSLAYLAAAIPFAMREAERAREAGRRARARS